MCRSDISFISKIGNRCHRFVECVAVAFDEQQIGPIVKRFSLIDFFR